MEKAAIRLIKYAILLKLKQSSNTFPQKIIILWDDSYIFIKLLFTTTRLNKSDQQGKVETITDYTGEQYAKYLTGKCQFDSSHQINKYFPAIDLNRQIEGSRLSTINKKHAITRLRRTMSLHKHKRTRSHTYLGI